jgi:hypothetical protein
MSTFGGKVLSMALGLGTRFWMGVHVLWVFRIDKFVKITNKWDELSKDYQNIMERPRPSRAYGCEIKPTILPLHVAK